MSLILVEVGKGGKLLLARAPFLLLHLLTRAPLPCVFLRIFLLCLANIVVGRALLDALPVAVRGAFFLSTPWPIPRAVAGVTEKLPSKRAAGSAAAAADGGGGGAG